MIAGYPYRILSDNAISSPMVFEGVTLKVIRNDECTSITHGDWTITGIITKEYLKAGTYMMLTDGRLTKGYSDGYMGGLRFYLVKSNE